MRQRGWIIAVVLLVLMVIAALLSQLRWRSEVVELGYQGEALRNPLYLAERLLVAMGRQADGTRLIPAVAELSPADTLLMSTPSYTLTRQQMSELLSWVEQGGHLITAVNQVYDPEQDQGSDLLLDHLGITVSEVGLDDPDAAARQTQELLGRAIHFKGSARLHTVDDRVLFRLDEAHGAFLLQYGLDDGLVTLLTDLSVFDNQRLVESDHAEFLWELAGKTAATGKLWLQYSHQVPSLLAVLVERAWMPLLGLSLALAAWIWQRGRRFGPLVELSPPARRSLLEHIRASGRFLWRRRLAVVLLAAVRRRGQQRLMRHIPGWRGLDDEARAAHAARLAQLPIDEVRAALRADYSNDFLATVKILSRLASL